MENNQKDCLVEMSKPNLLLLSILCFCLAFSQPSLVWWKEHDGGFDDYAQAVAVDGSNNVIITGSSYNGVNFDCFTIKYNSLGDTIWTRRFDSGASDMGQDVAIDDFGDIVVVGSSRFDTIYDYLSIKYDIQGNLVWVRRYQNGLNNFGKAVSIDHNQNVHVTGYADNGNDYDYLTIKYSSTGDTIWTRRYDTGTNEIASDLAVDAEGGSIVNGSILVADSFFPYYLMHTVKYDSSGVISWTRTYGDGALNGRGVAVDSVDNVVVLGYAWGMYDIVKYNSRGDSLWSFTTSWDDDFNPRDIVTDRYNDIYITGEHNPWCQYFSYNFGTRKYLPNGDTLWSVDYPPGFNEPDEFSYGVAVDSSGSVYVTGYKDNGIDFDYLTIKYTESGAICEKPLPFTRRLECYSYPNPFKSSTTIRYSTKSNDIVRINVYDRAGELVRVLQAKSHQSGIAAAVWDGMDKAGESLPSGVYFVQIKSSNTAVTEKVVKLD